MLHLVLVDFGWCLSSRIMRSFIDGSVAAVWSSAAGCTSMLLSDSADRCELQSILAQSLYLGPSFRASGGGFVVHRETGVELNTGWFIRPLKGFLRLI